MAYSFLRRLNSDGSIDNTLKDIDGNIYQDTTGNIGIRSIIIKPDENISIGGDFFFLDDSVNNIANFDSNGTLLNNQFGGSANECTFLTFHNNKFYFSCLTEEYKIIRLNSDFSEDTSFTSPIFNYQINHFIFDDNDKILVAEENNIIRLNSDGSIDNTFDTISTDAIIYKLCKAIDGRIYVGGNFTTVLLRLNADGTIDNSFSLPPANYLTYVKNIQLLYDGRIMVSGNFSFPDSNSNVIVLTSNGDMDDTFINPGFNDYVIFDNIGNTTFVAQYYTPDLRKLDSSLNQDLSFTPELPESFYITAIKIQSDGKILLAGNTESDTDKQCLIRLNSDGSADNTFEAHNFPLIKFWDQNFPMIGTILIVDNNIVIGGNFRHIDEEKRFNFVELDNNGNLIHKDVILFDGTSFTTIYSLITDSSNKLIVCGSFSINGYNNIMRLNSDGTIDETYPSINVNDSINKIIQLENGKFIIAGNFYEIDSQSYNGIARLNADGTLDTSFSPLNISSLNTVELQTDGKILIGGDFSDINSDETYKYVARLNADGTLDTSFSVDFYSVLNIHSIKFDSLNNKIIIAGSFSFGENNDIGLARLNLDGSLDTTPIETFLKESTVISSN